MPNASRRSLRRTARGRVVKRRARRMRVPRPMALRPKNVLRITRKFYLTQWVWTTTTTSDFWKYQTFTAALIPNFAEYASVFDEYRIGALKWTFMPRYTDVEAASAGTTGTPTAYAHMLIDAESTLVPSGVYGSGTLNNLMENTKVRTRVANKPFSVYYKPKILQQGFGGGTAGIVRNAPFIRTSDTSVDHRGHHIYVQQNNFSASANANIIFDVFVTVYMTLRNTR